VRVNSVAPTYIATEMTKSAAADLNVSKHWIDGTPMGRLGEPEEIASVILFLAGAASSLMTGAVVSADGGYTCW
jgi:NAD(P)-dependent dehydrogenase (short-subunit alcohol dehydrogenase family)